MTLVYRELFISLVINSPVASSLTVNSPSAAKPVVLVDNSKG